MTKRKGLQIGSPDEVAYQLKLIDSIDLCGRAQKYKNNEYGKYLFSLIKG
jgi:glucose-1-phosphate thymidylyltransferase